jgi:hypothetical protein
MVRITRKKIGGLILFLICILYTNGQWQGFVGHFAVGILSFACTRMLSI